MSSDIFVEIGSDKLNFSTGYLAKQADGSVAVSCNETMVLATVVASKDIVEGLDHFPLSVDYREKFYAAGKIPGGFLKREQRPSDKEILTSRLTDRPIRPLFPKDYVNEVQVIIQTFSADPLTQPDILAINAASAALSISGIPFQGPIGAVRVGRIEGNYIVNPNFEEIEKSDIDLIVAGTKSAVTMIEGLAKNVNEEDMISAVEFAHENVKKICDIQEEFKSKHGKEIMEYTPKSSDEELHKLLREKYFKDIEGLVEFQDKKEREAQFNSIVNKAVDELKEQFPDSHKQIMPALDEFDGEVIRKRILDEKIRADGRGLKDIRPIDVMVGILPRAHGSAVFTRGQTQSLGVATLAPISESQRLDALEGQKYKNFMLHYNFPPFSVGEVRRFGGSAGRREIGHGMLAERSLEYVLPDKEEFPYAIRVVSEILESNGSSSMATVCSGSLSLFNAGVPLKASVAGIAMGLVMEEDKYAVLSDILGLEDHLGDMDFKVAGTSEGITGFQMDIKIQGITPEIMREALFQAKENRLFILGKMDAVISKPESDLSPYAPKIVTINIDRDKIGGVIGPGGKIIRAIIESTGADVNVDDDGTVTISGIGKESIDNAIMQIEAITEDLKVGTIYKGTVKKIMDFGAFVEIVPGKEGLCHISKLDFKRVEKVTDILKEGDEVDVKVIGIDKFGRIDLSRKDALKRE